MYLDACGKLWMKTVFDESHMYELEGGQSSGYSVKYRS